MVVPPPMAAHELSLPSPALLVSFAPSPRCNDFIVLLSDGRVAVFKYETVGDGDQLTVLKPTGAPKLVGTTRCVCVCVCV